MKKVKIFSRQAVVVLLLLLLLTAMDWSNASCGGQQAGSAGAGAASREPYDLDIYSYQNGTFSYIFGIALAEILNETHPWIRATTVESMGAGPNELMMYTADDYKRKHTIYFGNGYQAWRGTGAFEGKQTNRSKLTFCIGLVVNGLVTANPNITKIEDYAGKSMAVRTGGAVINLWWTAMFDPIVPGIKYERLDFTSAVEGNLSGSLDGWFCVFSSLSANLKEWTGNPATVEFLSRTRHVGFIDMPMEEGKKLRAVRGGPFEDFFQVVVPIPARSIAPEQTKPWHVTLSTTLFMVDQDFPADILHDIMKVVGANGAKFAEYHPQGAFISPQTMPIYIFPDSSNYHPGAIRYFNEVGVKPIFLGDLAEQLAK